MGREARQALELGKSGQLPTYSRAIDDVAVFVGRGRRTLEKIAIP
jgi:hypothetical protein